MHPDDGRLLFSDYDVQKQVQDRACERNLCNSEQSHRVTFLVMIFSAQTGRPVGRCYTIEDATKRTVRSRASCLIPGAAAFISSKKLSLQ